MKTTEQLSAMEMMAVSPVARVIAPRFWAGFISMPILAALFSMVGVLGGYFVAVPIIGVDAGAFWSQMQASVDFRDDIVNGIIKSLVFGVFPGNSVERDYLPQAYSDFIYSIIVEEMGLIGGIVVIIMYLILLFRAGRIVMNCSSVFPAILLKQLTRSLSSWTMVIRNCTAMRHHCSPADKLNGRDLEIFKERDRKLEEARELRKQKRQQYPPSTDQKS